MNRLKQVVAVLFAAFLTGCCCMNESPVKDSGTTFAADTLKPYIESGELPGALSFLYRNGVQETACLGWASVEKKTPMTMDKMFMQCSQTKGFCGVTIAMLVEEGKISLDDPVSKYLPYFNDLKVIAWDKNGKQISVPAKNTLTIRMVMNHTGGFPFEIPSKNKNGWSSLPLQETAKEAAGKLLRFEPGTAVQYSNTGIDIGAAVIEAVTGMPWEVFLKERVFVPLGMVDSTFNPTDEQLKRAISLYIVREGQKAKYLHFNRAMPRPYNGPGVHPSAGAGLWTTAADQLKFYKMLMNLGVGDNGVRILKEETVKNLLATSTRPQKLGYYSLGLSASPDGWFGHGGAWGTSCLVNWQKKQLRLWIVQQNGNAGVWRKKWQSASEQFFKAAIDNSGIDAYTGRTR